MFLIWPRAPYFLEFTKLKRLGNVMIVFLGGELNKKNRQDFYPELLNLKACISNILSIFDCFSLNVTDHLYHLNIVSYNRLLRALRGFLSIGLPQPMLVNGLAD